MEDLLWIEKYRPKLLDDIVGQDINKIKELIKEPMKMPNFLFVSKSAGTGKTTTALAIKNEIGIKNQDFMVTNSSDERKIDFIRNTLKSFALGMRSDKKKPRLILMDEFDGMLSASQEMLRGFIEKYKSNVRFILTANNEEDIIEPIKSRCVIIRFREPKKEDIMELLMQICDKESITNTGEGLRKLIDMYYPDMRSMINKLQELSSVGITEDVIKERTDLEDEYFTILSEKRSPYDARKHVIEHNLDVALLLKRTLENTMKISNDINKIRELTFFAAEINYRMSVGADKEIQMFAFSLKWLEIFR